MTDSLANYYKQERAVLNSFIPMGKHSILDVGCAAGYFGESLKVENKAEIVFGIEGFETAAAEARKRLDTVELADLERLNFESLKAEWQGKNFDYIVFGDVLEHLRDPWSVLASSKCMLKDDGRIIISLPNVRHWSVIVPLLFKGVWNYAPQGILDKTHFRFFTKSTAQELVESCSLVVEYANVPIEGIRSRILSKISMGLLDEFLGVQISVVAKKNN